MYRAYYLKRSDGDGDLAVVVNMTDIDEDLSEILTSQTEYLLKINGDEFFVVEAGSSDFPDVWENIDE